MPSKRFAGTHNKRFRPKKTLMAAQALDVSNVSMAQENACSETPAYLPKKLGAALYDCSAERCARWSLLGIPAALSGYR